MKFDIKVGAKFDVEISNLQFKEDEKAKSPHIKTGLALVVILSLIFAFSVYYGTKTGDYNVFNSVMLFIEKIAGKMLDSS